MCRVNYYMAQFSSPTGDINTGQWSPSPLYTGINEFVPDTTNYISSSIWPTGDTCEVILSGLQTPTGLNNHILSYYYQANFLDPKYYLNLIVGLYQGSTLLSGITYTGINTGWTSGNISLTTGQASNINDYNDLRIRFTAYTGTYLLSPIPDILWYKFLEGSGTVLNDSSLTGINSGQLSSSSMWTNGLNGSGFCISGDGAATFAQTFQNVNFNTNILTVCLWAFNPSWGGGTQIWIETDAAGYGTPNAGFIIDNEIGARNFGGIHSTNFRNEFQTLPSAGVWHHYAFILDDSTAAGDIRIFLDGIEQSTTIQDSSKSAAANYQTDTLYFFGRGGASLFSNAAFDDIRIYGRTLSSGEIQAVMNDPY